MSYTQNCVLGLILQNTVWPRETILKIGITRLRNDGNIRSRLRKTLESFQPNIDGFVIKEYLFAYETTDAVHDKRRMSACLTNNKLERWDIMNNNQDHTVDCFTWSPIATEILDTYLTENNININAEYFWACNICNEYIDIEDTERDLEGDDLIVCYNANTDVHMENSCCGFRIHDQCLNTYFRRFPGTDRRVDDDDWVCHRCI